MKKTLFVTLGIMLFLTACQDSVQEAEPVVRPVRIDEVGFKDGAAVRTFSGTAVTDKIINLSFRSGGIVKRFDARIGQRVRRGQLVGELDNVSARLAYEQSVSTLNSATSQLNTAKLTFNRTSSLYENGSASLSEFEAAKNGLNTAQANVESAQRSVEIQREQIRYGYIYAPSSGIIASVNTEVNENVSAGQVVAILNAGSEMEISLGIPESVINGISNGMEVDISFASLDVQVHRGVVSEVSPSVDVNTSTYPVRIAIQDPSSDIRSGMAANVSFSFDDSDSIQGLVVPANAVGEDGAGRFVFVIVEDANSGAVVRKQHVKLGALSSEGFEVLDGLQHGEKIVTAGLQTLLDGQAVRIQ